MKSRIKNEVLYFFTFGDHFKMGVTSNLKQRLEAIGREFEDEIDFHNSFYYEVTGSVAHNLETSLLYKYKDYLVKNEVYKNEVLNISVLENIEQDIVDFHDLFTYSISKKALVDKYVSVYDDEGKLKVQLTKNVKRIYDIFKGREEYFEQLFIEDEESDRP